MILKKRIVIVYFIALVFLDLSCKQIFEPLENNNSQKIYAFIEVDEKPIIIHKEPPIYPIEAIRDSIQGIVVVTIVIKPDSCSDVLEVFKSVHVLLDSAAVDAVKLCKFKPAIHKGKPVNCSLNLPFYFKLDDRSTG
jgi:TonB family protein